MFAAVSVVWMITTAAPAGTTPDSANPHLPAALERLRSLDERGALAELEKARAWPENTAEELARIHLLIGLAWGGLGEGAAAIGAFEAALLLDGAIQLPPGQSPRIVEWWERAGGRSAPQEVVALPAPAVPVLPAASTSPRFRRTAGFVSVGLGAIALGAGAALGARAGSLEGQMTDEPSVGGTLAVYRQATQSATAANILFVVGGALLVVGGVVAW